MYVDPLMLGNNNPTAELPELNLSNNDLKSKQEWDLPCNKPIRSSCVSPLID